MRIAIDARELAGHATGVGRYLSNLLREWRQMPAASAHEFIELAPAAGEGRGTWWEQMTLPRLVSRANADVLFSPGYSGPIRSRVPMVVAIHDVSFAAHPEWFAWREGLRRRTITRFAAQRAARVLTISDFSKQEIVRHLGVAGDKIEVTYLGVTSFLPASETPPPRDPLVLYVGSIFNRRHVPELIDGFARVAQRHPEARLELVGDNRTHPRVDLAASTAAHGVAARVGIGAYVPDAELASLYRRASAFVFLSDYEGFGLTPLEALSAGIPIVVLDTAVAREIYGPAAIYVASPDPSLIARALEQALFDAAERERLLHAAMTVLPRYSWTECARRTLQVLVAAGKR